jgi:hypothetical protein
MLSYTVQLNAPAIANARSISASVPTVGSLYFLAVEIAASAEGIEHLFWRAVFHSRLPNSAPKRSRHEELSVIPLHIGRATRAPRRPGVLPELAGTIWRQRSHQQRIASTLAVHPLHSLSVEGIGPADRGVSARRRRARLPSFCRARSSCSLGTFSSRRDNTLAAMDFRCARARLRKAANRSSGTFFHVERRHRPSLGKSSTIPAQCLATCE